MTPPRLGGLVALAAILLDQAHKWWMLLVVEIGPSDRIQALPFLDLVMVWNHGISYGLLTQDSDLGRWMLIALGLGGALLFAFWLRHADRLLPALGFGLIIGGALSNVIDRLAHGAVADFFLFHIGRFEWYVFNLADAFIVAGVIGILLAWATERRENAQET